MSKQYNIIYFIVVQEYYKAYHIYKNIDTEELCPLYKYLNKIY